MTLAETRLRIGLFVQSFANQYTMSIVRALHASAIERGVDLVAFAGGDYRASDDFAPQRNLGFRLANHANVDGLLVLQIGTHVTPRELGQFIHGFAPLPACTIGAHCPGFPAVILDNDRATRALVEHLVVKHQRRRILFIRGPMENSEVKRRFQVYQDSLKLFDIPFREELVLAAKFSSESARREVAQRLGSSGLDFDAVLAATDSIAIGALTALQQAGVHVPSDVSVMGYDDIIEAWATYPPLSTVRQPWRIQADAALDALTAQIAGEQVFETLLVSAELVPRRSCGCFESSIEHAGDSSRPSSAHAAPGAFGRVELEMGKLMVGADRYLPSGWSEALAQAFYRDLETGGREFPSAIEQLSRDLVLVGAPVRWFQEAISRIRGSILPGLPEGARARRAEDLLQQARLICADAAERQQLSRLMDAERATEVLADATRALVTSFEVPALRTALLAQLPRLGIRAAYLVLYEGSGEPPAKSRLVLAYDAERPEQDAGPDRLIDTECLIPKDALPARRTTLALMPLYFEELQIGAALFELGSENGVIYEALREVLSAALKGARLRGELALEAAQREKAERDRLSQELEIAARIQTSILPKDLQVEGLEIAAGMLPATEVGGDYYDVLPVEGGAWLGIGDVAGHGLRPGLVMVMLQSIVAAVVSHTPEIAPREMVQIVNRVLYENVRQRLHQDEHATLSLMRYQRSGRLSFAGAHEDIIVYRARTRRCETVVTPGTWVAATRDIAPVTVDSSLELARGDVLLLYTDGVIEATNAQREPFGIERLCRELERLGRDNIETIRDQLLRRVTEWVDAQNDDIALLVARQLE